GGRPGGSQRVRPKHGGVPAARSTTGAIRVDPARHHVTLPRLGRLKTHESTRKLARRIEAGTARILSATLRQDNGRWFVSFTCEVERAEHAPARPDTVVGVDLGIKHLAVLSTGQTIANPRHLPTATRKLRPLSPPMSP